jgi:DNA-binding response OmpR family regulator
MGAKILIVEDDARMADFLVRGLVAEGHALTHVASGEEAVARAKDGVFDLIVLDLMLPEMHGHDVCQSLRHARVATPILMLTALDTVGDKVRGLRLGADDYMTKPFAFDDLLARIDALLKSGGCWRRENSVASMSGLEIDSDTLTARAGGETVQLPMKEFAILEFLLNAPGEAFSRECILSNIWGLSVDPGDDIVDTHIKTLQEKLEYLDAPAKISPGQEGYRLVADKQ